MMNLYLIEQNKNTDWDTYDSAVVLAENESEARLIHPDGRADWDGEGKKYGEWTASKNVTVTLIGKSDLKLKGVVLASFNAL